MKLAFSVSLAGCIAPSLSIRLVKNTGTDGARGHSGKGEATTAVPTPAPTPNEWEHEDYVAGPHEPCLMYGGIVLRCSSGYSCHRGVHGLYTCEEPLPPPTLAPPDGTPPPPKPSPEDPAEATAELASFGMHTEESPTPNSGKGDLEATTAVPPPAPTPNDWEHEDYVAGPHEPCLMHGGIVLRCSSGYSCHRGFHGLYTCEEPLPPPTYPPADGTPPPDGGKGGDTPEDGIELAEVSLSTESNTSSLKFVYGAYGATGCPSGTRAATLSECGQATSFFGKSGVYQENIYDSAPGCMYYSYDNRIWYNHQVRASGYRMCKPICVEPTQESLGGFGLSPTQFNSWMNYWQTQSVAMGGYACHITGSWCACSCGNNQGVNCYLPPMRPGTTGGHTCGYYGVLYGCAEGHNTISGCPVGSGGTPYSGKGDGTFTGKGV